MTLAFSVLEAATVIGADDPAHGRGRRIVIGSIQHSLNAGAALCELGTAAHRLQPTALLVLGVQALSQAWGLGAPLGVALDSRLPVGDGVGRRQVAVDHDAAWMEAGGYRTGRHYWMLPAWPVLQPETEATVESESRRQAKHRRRNTLRRAVLDAVTRRAGALTSG